MIEGHNLTVTAKETLPVLPYRRIKEKILGTHYDLSIACISAAAAQSLNTAHRGRDYVPNTLSFPLTPHSGEIIICGSAARKECASFGMSFKKYLIYLLIHSCLHLKGYAHGGTMERMERRLLTLFS